MSRLTQLRTFDDGVDAWQIGEGPPDAALRASIDRYCWWRETTQSFTTRRELAATHGVFIVNLGAPLEIVDAQGTTIRLDAGDGFLGGMAQATSLSRSAGAMEGVHVHMPVDEIARLAGVSLSAIGDCTATLEDVIGLSARDLGGRLMEAGTIDARFAILDAFFADRLRRARDRDDALSHAFRHLGGRRHVSGLADDLGWSRKRLAAWFRDRTGLKPAQFIRLARFEQFAAALQATPAASLADLAYASGYADQAHLTRDVRRLSQMTPGELRARLIPAGGGVRD